MKKNHETMVKYSVIVPAYNAMSTIQSCLEALVLQSVKKEEYEIILVDDGSIDETSDRAKPFPIEILRQKNQGPATARNRGVEEAKGAIVLFTDSDCVPQENWIEEMVRPFNNPQVMAVKGVYRTNQRSLTARFAQIEFDERYRMLEKVEAIDMVDTYSAAYRKAIFLSHGGFDRSFPEANNEDTELSYKMSQAGHKMTFSPAAIVYHLKHPDSPKKYARLKFWRGYWRMAVYKRYPGKMLKDSYTPQTLKIQILFSFLFLLGLPLMALLPKPAIFLIVFSVAGFILSALPLTVSAVRKDLIVGLCSLFFIFIRAVSLGLGALWGGVSPRVV